MSRILISKLKNRVKTGLVMIKVEKLSSGRLGVTINFHKYVVYK